MKPAFKLDLNPQFKQALEKMEDTHEHVFVTGRAGTGKSTLLTYFREHTKKNIVVLAPTGVAAVNVQGQTIHSFFKFKPDITISKVRKNYKKIRKPELYRKLATIVIDEISMVRADLLDCVDEFLRLHGPQKGQPFGGVQIIMIGDLYQLPPVVTNTEREIFSTHYPSPYFFDAQAIQAIALTILELTQIYRQRDQGFIEILNAVRNRSINEKLLATLNQRVQANFVAPKSEVYIHLTTTNAKASEINHEHLQALSTRRKIYTGTVQGQFAERALPVPQELSLKVSAQVMLCHNDREGRWINGTMGRIVDIETVPDAEDVIWVELHGGKIVEIVPYTWEMFQFQYNQQAKRIESQTIGSFTQYPLILAWAVTIHKAQGKTFERVVVDMDRGAFAHGQTYVALSRATSLEGLVLIKPITLKHLLLDWRVVKFLTGFQYAKSEASLPLKDKVKLIEQAITQNQVLQLTYLKANDERSNRKLKPSRIGNMTYMEKTFLGVEGWDELRGAERVFRVDRILELAVVG